MAEALHIIAEAGTNHGGRLQAARRLVDHAVDARADSVKFQVIYPEGLYLPRLYEEGVYRENEVFELRRQAMLSDDDYAELVTYCRDRNMPVSASVFDRRGLELLHAFDVPYIKMASCDLNNGQLLRQAAELGRKMIVSTGMATLGEIEEAVNGILSTGHDDVVLMHCVSAYPCPLDQMNLNFITVLRAAFGLPVGLSDHTESSLAGAIAVALGATWIEKHLTYDRTACGFDHAYALEPESFAGYVADLRAAFDACQPETSKIRPDEAGVKPRARRSVYAARRIEAGHVIGEEDLLIVRPEGPLAPNDGARVVGRRAKRTIEPCESLQWDQFE